MTVVSVSGTRLGWTPEQRRTFEALVGALPAGPHTLHHGDCVGVDLQCHDLWSDILLPICWVVVHPPLDERYRAHAGGRHVMVLSPKEYRARDADLARACDVLWAFPEGPEHNYPRSGTWMTVRMARRAGVPVVVVRPDGGVEE
jgi:hypothetical protein